MLIGYKDDLDKRLVQSYSNTGAVHIIAISGLHLGLIYWLLMLLCKPLANHKKGRILQPVLIITGLWLFSFLAGGSPFCYAVCSYVHLPCYWSAYEQKNSRIQQPRRFGISASLLQSILVMGCRLSVIICSSA